jgi:uncharacterized protein (DUF488 family)
LYDVGYGEIGSPKLLAAVAEKLKARVVDIRIIPNSRIPGWTKSSLEKLLGERYVHLKSLGNINYKGGPIKFVNLEDGVVVVKNLLNVRPVILMCMCKDRSVCHRLEFIRIFYKREGVNSIPLTVELCRELVALQKPRKETMLRMNI